MDFLLNALSAGGNPHLDTFVKIFDAIDKIHKR